VGYRHAMELAIQVARPEVEEILQSWKAGVHVVVLPKRTSAGARDDPASGRGSPQSSD
jgi:hypothetical protein